MRTAAILEAVATVTGIPATEITSRKRSRPVYQARSMAALILFDFYPKWAATRISLVIGRSNHMCSIYSANNARWLVATNPRYRESYKEATNLLNQLTPCPH